MEPLELQTQYGPARAHIESAARPLGALVLGHGAGGGVRSPDLTAVAELAHEQSIVVALVEQPYRVAGRRSPAPADQLDAAWLEVLETLSSGPLRGRSLVCGGRSSGARVACRTSAQTGCVGVLCLAFPLHPPGRGDDPSKSRLHELEAVRLPTLVVQGERDPFGIPPAGAGRVVRLVPGTHSLRSAAPVRAALGDWLLERFAT